MKHFLTKNVMLLFLLSVVTAFKEKPKPALYIIGDSTVKNSNGKGEGGLWGWGDFITNEFDTTKIHIENHARGGRSSRTFQTEGLWKNVMDKLKPGDYVIIQFGHNDRSAINDTLRARGTIRGIGEETEEIDNLITKKHEIVHSFGWYMRKYIQDIKAKGCTPVVCSPVARNQWNGDKVVRVTDSYATWAQQVCEQEEVCYIDLNDLVATRYEQLGPEEVKTKLFIKDDTHTTEAGAIINAKLVANALKDKAISLKKYLKK